MNINWRLHHILLQKWCTSSWVYLQTKWESSAYVNPTYVTPKAASGRTNIYSTVSDARHPTREVKINKQNQQPKSEREGGTKCGGREGEVLTRRKETSRYSACWSFQVRGESRCFCSNYRIVAMEIREPLRYANTQKCPLWLERLTWQHCQRKHQVITFHAVRLAISFRVTNSGRI